MNAAEEAQKEFKELFNKISFIKWNLKSEEYSPFNITISKNRRQIQFAIWINQSCIKVEQEQISRIMSQEEPYGNFKEELYGNFKTVVYHYEEKNMTDELRELIKKAIDKIYQKAIQRSNEELIKNKEEMEKHIQSAVTSTKKFLENE